MNRREVKQMINEICENNAYYQFEGDTSVSPPFCCFYFPDDTFFYADNRNEARIGHLVIEIYTAHKNFTLERQAENVLRSHDLTFTRDETYINDEQLYLSAFYTDVLIDD